MVVIEGHHHQPLNPEAPDFIPHHHNHRQLQPNPWPTVHPFYQTHQYYYYYHHHYYFTHSSLHPHHFYYPFTSPLFPSSEPPQPKPTPFQNTAYEPSAVEAHVAVQQEKEKEKEVANNKTASDSSTNNKGFVLSSGKLEDRRSNANDQWKRKEKDQAALAKCGRFMNNNNHQSRRAFAFLSDHQRNKRRRHQVFPVRRDGDETTVMIRNIPSKYTRSMLVEFLENHCKRVNEKEKEAGTENGEEKILLAFDFVYLPIDFRSGLNKGYAFVNFTKAKAAWKFRSTASGMKWDLFQSHKIRNVVAARLQGKEKLESHFETMSFPCYSEEVLPISFSPPRDGVVKGSEKTMGRLINRV